VARRGIGRTFQIVKPFAHMTVLENVMVGAFARTARVAEAQARALETLELVGLGRYREHLAASLSIGHRKRLELAKALAARPRLLLLDEVMGGLAPPEVTAMIQLLRRIAAGGVTMVLIEHVMKAVMSLSDRVVVLQNGQVIAVGRPEEIGRDPRVIEAYLGEEYRHAAGG
jgi:ABC-type branched-subunit amino acid transport system ATPase component